MLEPLKDVLKRLRWSESQIGVYCTLVEKGAMKPADLVILAGVAQGKIYSVLEELQRKGAIMKAPGSPTKYDAQNPLHVLNSLISEVERMSDLALETAVQAFEKRSEQLVGKLNCWTVHGISGILVELRQLISECKKTVRICDSDLNLFGKAEYKVLRGLLKQRRKVQVLSTSSFVDQLDDLQNNRADVKTLESIPTAYYIFDDEKVLIRLNSPDSGLVIMDKEIVTKKVKEFEDSFNNGKNVKGLSI